MVNFKRGDRAYLATDYENLKQHEVLIICNVIYDEDGVEMIFAAEKCPEKKYIILDHEIDYLILEEDAYFTLKAEYNVKSNKTTYVKPFKKEKSTINATVLEKKVTTIKAYLSIGNYEESVNLLLKEGIKLSSLDKEEVQLVVNMALDAKDYDTLNKLYG